MSFFSWFSKKEKQATAGAPRGKVRPCDPAGMIPQLHPKPPQYIDEVPDLNGALSAIRDEKEKYHFLMPYLLHPHSTTRAEAATLSVGIDCGGLDHFLANLLADDSDSVRQAALHALRRRGTVEDAARMLQDEVESEMTLPRKKAMAALQLLRSRVELLDSPFAKSTLANVDTLKRRYPLTNELSEAETRAIIQAKEDAPRSRAPDLAAVLLNDQSDEKRELAALAIGRMRAHELGPVFESVLMAESEPEWLRVQIAEELGRWKSVGVAALFRALAVKSPLVRCGVLDGLQRAAEDDGSRRSIFRAIQAAMVTETHPDVKNKFDYISGVITRMMH